MIDYTTYKMFHLLGIFAILVTLGGLALYTANGGAKSNNRFRKPAAILHGIGLVLVLVTGFGMLARLGITKDIFQGWILAKIGIWVVMGALLPLVTRKQSYAKWIFYLLPLLAFASAFFAIHKL